MNAHVVKQILNTGYILTAIYSDIKWGSNPHLIKDQIYPNNMGRNINTPAIIDLLKTSFKKFPYISDLSGSIDNIKDPIPVINILVADITVASRECGMEKRTGNNPIKNQHTSFIINKVEDLFTLFTTLLP